MAVGAYWGIAATGQWVNKTLVIIRFFDDDATEWGRFDGDGRLLDGPRGGLPPRDEAGDDRVVALAPGEAVLLTSASVPTRNPAKLRRALPYALEERLVGDVAGQHVAAGEPGGDGKVTAAVVARARLDGWLSRLDEAGVAPDALVPEALALPLEGAAPTVLLEGGRALVRTGRHAGFGCERELVPALLPEEERGAARVFRAADAGPPPGGLEPGSPLGATVLEWLAPQAADAAIDLLQGDYRPRRRARAGQRLWLAAALLVLAWGVLEVGMATADYLRLRSANEALDARIEAVFTETFPGQPVRDPVAQMRQQLGLLTRPGASPLALFRGVAPVLEQAVNVRLLSLEYRENGLTLAVEADNIGALDALRNALAASGAYRVELASASATEAGVDGRLVIEGGGA